MYSNQNPFDQSELVKIQLASVGDIDRAYTEASFAQKIWQKTSPDKRAAIIKKSAKVIESRRAEIIETLVAETGSSHAKAQAEIGLVLADIQGLATLSLRMKSEVVPSEYLIKKIGFIVCRLVL